MYPPFQNGVGMLVTIHHPISLTPVYFTSLRASHLVCFTENGEKPYCSMFLCLFFILQAFRYFMVELKKCTIPIRHHYEAVPKIHIDAPIWIFVIVM